MKRTVHESRYFCGNKISDYGLENGYLDYRTLAQAFDAVLVNDIPKLFYADINGEYSEAEQINGYIDHSEQIENLEEQIETLRDTLEDPYDAAHAAYLEEQIEALEEKIRDLEYDQEYQPEIFQYYIVSGSGAEIIQEYTNDPLFYIPVLDCYVWGVTHWGTSWDYVLTDVRLDLGE